MTYSAIVRMSRSIGLKERILAASAQEGIDQPEVWVNVNWWFLISGEDWIDAWEYAEGTMSVNNNPDIGAREDVINDGMVLSAVQARFAEINSA